MLDYWRYLPTFYEWIPTVLLLFVSRFGSSPPLVVPDSARLKAYFLACQTTISDGKNPIIQGAIPIFRAWIHVIPNVSWLNHIKSRFLINKSRVKQRNFCCFAPAGLPAVRHLRSQAVRLGGVALAIFLSSCVKFSPGKGTPSLVKWRNTNRDDIGCV